jgi:hypothetical protein
MRKNLTFVECENLEILSPLENLAFKNGKVKSFFPLYV